VKNHPVPRLLLEVLSNLLEWRAPHVVREGISEETFLRWLLFGQPRVLAQKILDFGDPARAYALLPPELLLAGNPAEFPDLAPEVGEPRELALIKQWVRLVCAWELEARDTFGPDDREALVWVATRVVAIHRRRNTVPAVTGWTYEEPAPPPLTETQSESRSGDNVTPTAGQGEQGGADTPSSERQ
jgi:hypothetical protein